MFVHELITALLEMPAGRRVYLDTKQDTESRWEVVRVVELDDSVALLDTTEDEDDGDED